MADRLCGDRALGRRREADRATHQEGGGLTAGSRLEQLLPPLAESLLFDGEKLVGCCVATWQKTFSGRNVAIAVTDRRIVVQPVDRKFAPDGEPISLTSETVASAKVTGGGNDGILVENMVMDSVSIAATIRTTGGLTLKLMAMRGDGLLGELSGGEMQRTGVEALQLRLGVYGQPR